MKVFLIAVSVLFCVICYLIYRQSMNYTMLREENKRLREIIEYQTKNNRRLEKFNRYIQKTNHDMKHYFIKLSALMEKKQYEQVRREINDYCHISFKKLNVYIPDDENLNYVLNAKKIHIEEKNIQLSCEIRIASEIPLDIGEMSILLGNAIDNAVTYLEKNRQLPQEINLLIRYEHDVFVIIVKNPVKNQIKILDNGIIRTTKKMPGHGIGLRSIKALAKKYGGDIKISCSPDEFCLEIILIIGRDRH